MSVLGHVIHHGSIQMDPTKVSAVNVWTLPEFPKQLQHLQGLQVSIANGIQYDCYSPQSPKLQWFQVFIESPKAQTSFTLEGFTSCTVVISSVLRPLNLVSKNLTFFSMDINHRRGQRALSAGCPLFLSGHRGSISGGGLCL